MNLYDFSINNNIEVGVKCESSLMSSESLIDSASKYFKNVLDNAQTVYKQEVIVSKSFGGLKTKYEGIKVLEDNTQDFYKSLKEHNNSKNYIESNKKEKRQNYKEEQKHYGFCIRSGTEISFNPKRPYGRYAYNSWVENDRRETSERFCHFTGEKSNGETSFTKPVLRKNWDQAKKYINPT